MQDFCDHKPTARVLDVLEALVGSDNGLTLTELSVVIGAPKSTLQPIVKTLCKRKYISLERLSGKYAIGISTYAAGTIFSSRNSLLPLVFEEMQYIVNCCSEICQLGVLDRGAVLYVGKVDSPEPIRLISRVGVRLPASCTALGKALLSGLDNAAIRALYPDGLPRLTPSSVVDIADLEEQLEAIRNGGIACEIGESNEELQCLAVPLLYGTQRVDAAMSVSVPRFRINDEKLAMIYAALRKGKANIERYMQESRLTISGSLEMGKNL